MAPSGSGDVAGTLFRLRKHLKQNYALSMMAIGRFLEVGGGGVSRDYAAAKKCYEKALLREPRLIEALLGIARLTYYGRGVERDVGKAKALYEYLAESDEPVALYMLGIISWRDEKDIATAVAYFSRCVGAGHVTARLRLAELRIRSGSVISGGLQWVWALGSVLAVSVRNPYDERLRTS